MVSSRGLRKLTSRSSVWNARFFLRLVRESHLDFEISAKLNLTVPNFTNIVNIENNATAASSSSASASGAGIPIIRPFAVHPVTPNKTKSKLNPAVEAFTPSNPSNSSGKDSMKSGNMKAASPSKSESEPSAIVSNAKDEGFVPPHLRRPSKISTNAEPVSTTGEPSVKDKIKDQANVASSAQSNYTKEFEPYQATSLAPRVFPHLRRQIKNEDAHPPQSQPSSKGKNKENMIEGGELFSRDSTFTNTKENAKAATTSGASVKLDPGLQAWLDSQEKARFNNASTHDSASMPNETLIVIDPDSPEFISKKTVPLPPGFIPISTKDAPVKAETAAPIEIKTSKAASPITAQDPIIHRNSATKDEAATPGLEVPAKTTSEKEKNAAFIAEYNKGLSSISANYGKESRNNSDAKEDGVDPVQHLSYDPVKFFPHFRVCIPLLTKPNHTDLHPPQARRNPRARRPPRRREPPHGHEAAQRRQRGRRGRRARVESSPQGRKSGLRVVIDLI